MYKIIINKTTIILSILILLTSCEFQDKKLQKIETVLNPGDVITIENEFGKLEIKAGSGLVRQYTWDGATRNIEMWPRKERWFGSLGLYYPGPSNHWESHNGITRAVVEEGLQHFKTIDEALIWIRNSNHIPYFYTSNGLVGGWRKSVNPNNQNEGVLHADVWQILINGEKPNNLPGGDNRQIQLTSK